MPSVSRCPNSDRCACLVAGNRPLLLLLLLLLLHLLFHLLLRTCVGVCVCVCVRVSVDSARSLRPSSEVFSFDFASPPPGGVTVSRSDWWHSNRNRGPWLARLILVVDRQCPFVRSCAVCCGSVVYLRTVFFGRGGSFFRADVTGRRRDVCASAAESTRFFIAVRKWKLDWLSAACGRVGHCSPSSSWPPLSAPPPVIALFLFSPTTPCLVFVST